ncbi:FAD-linked oxidoreductase [Auriculariales sp. MPI-PUGE-AT-0066]|nr:FAD-linked oxidoreductase [Auriculariales sp. MPI-PUGE-AT-0066]
MAAVRALRYGAAITTAVALSQPIVWNDDERSRARRQRPISALLRAYAVYSACSIPILVDASPKILSTLGSIPVVNFMAEDVIRRTFYAQFVGGDTARATLPLLRNLRNNSNVGCLFAYSVEDDEDASGSGHYKARVKETLHCIDVAADFEDEMNSGQRKTWVAIKLSAFLPSAESLHSLSTYLTTTRSPLPDVPFPGHGRPTDLVFLDVKQSLPADLTASDVAALRELWNDLSVICARAKQRRVRVIVDAEYSWWQPAIDAYTVALSRTFNKDEPLVYGTYQAYLRRTPAQIRHALKDAKREGYSLGVKLVRGAYHPHEIARHAKMLDASATHPATPSHVPKTVSLVNPPPVWEKIEDTDATYAACTSILLDAVQKDVFSKCSWYCRWSPASTNLGIGLLFGTHNARSAAGVVHGLLARELAVTTEPVSDAVKLIPIPAAVAAQVKPDEVPFIEIDGKVADRVAIGQLYGMCDWLTDKLSERVKAPSPFVIKFYIPYGALEEVMPYLSRRAIENKSVLGGRGGAADERKRAGKELSKRLFGVKDSN